MYLRYYYIYRDLVSAVKNVVRILTRCFDFAKIVVCSVAHTTLLVIKDFKQPLLQGPPQ